MFSESTLYMYNRFACLKVVFNSKHAQLLWPMFSIIHIAHCGHSTYLLAKYFYKFLTSLKLFG